MLRPIVLSTCLFALSTTPSRAETLFPVRESAIIETILSDGLGAAQGLWRSRAQVVFAPGTQEVERRTYELFDFAPARDLDFSWMPDDLSADRPGKITGTGRLVWRLKDTPAYDASGIVSAYHGAMRHGRAEGHGSYASRNGLSYEGQWKAGRPHGRGRLVLPGGEEYVGSFRDGFAEGEGRFTETTWERFEGTFRKGRRAGAGKTTLPSGLSYDSHWIAGRETPNSVRIRIAQAGAAPAIGGIDDIKMGITMERKPKGVEPEGVVLYMARATPEGLTVEPNDKRLVNVWKNQGEISLYFPKEKDYGSRDGVFAFGKGYFQPAKFNISVQNKSTAPVEIKTALLEVINSETENQPAIEYKPGYWGNCSVSYLPKFTLQNYGWTPAENGVLKLSFQSVDDKSRPATPKHTLNIGNLTNAVKTISIEDLLAAEKVKISTLRQREGKFTDCDAGNPGACLDKAKASGIYGNISNLLKLKSDSIEIQLRGTYEYNWKDAKGAGQTSRHPITVTASIGSVPSTQECGAGESGPPVREKPVVLKQDGQNYNIALPFRRAIPAGRTASFAIPIETPKSSSHQFRIKLQLSDGREISSPIIRLLYFRANGDLML